MSKAAFRQGGWPGIRARLFHGYFLLSRPMTLGVRAVVHDRNGHKVFLIRHTYVPGWHLPGGGVEKNETVVQALTRELSEEGNFQLLAPPLLRSLHFNRHASPRDHVAVFLVEDFRQHLAKAPDREIADSGFFALDELPEMTTPGTRRRIAETFEGAPVSEYW
ncbi:MAG: DNA mismatch repair protein MutT [Rhizobiales bacterium 65-79]|jgi:ADP-ribose pyrophosphatase YjhB (NUDIX family)|nr:NUDIX domain-containing protein [Hyphomicrobiales bacterium]OJU04057.1 MAG: DNA mismatch repair protein MutT [Rhizobiales bacterium 65-79]